jgi:peptide/nickel transport system permease protein
MLFVLTILIFAVISLAPGGPVGVVAGSASGPPSAQTLAEMRKNLGLDDPMPVQYFRWLSHIIRGDLGKSYVTGEPVTSIFLNKLPATFLLMGSAILLALLISIPLGVLTARFANSRLDQILMTGAIIGVSIPDFWLALMLLTFLASRLGWFPVGAMYTPGREGNLLDLLRHLILPAIAVAIPLIGSWSRYIRSSMLEVLDEPYIRTAKAKGMTERAILLEHAFKNALLPLITMIGLSVPLIFSGGAVIEYLFAWPGIGWKYLASAVNYHDYPIILGGLIVVSFLTVLGSLVADIGYAIIDPRIRDRFG